MIEPTPWRTWRKSSFTQGANNCVELHPTGKVRDSKNPSGGTLEVGLAALLRAVRRVQREEQP